MGIPVHLLRLLNLTQGRISYYVTKIASHKLHNDGWFQETRNEAQLFFWIALNLKNEIHLGIVSVQAYFFYSYMIQIWIYIQLDWPSSKI